MSGRSYRDRSRSRERVAPLVLDSTDAPRYVYVTPPRRPVRSPSPLSASRYESSEEDVVLKVPASRARSVSPSASSSSSSSSEEESGGSSSSSSDTESDDCMTSGACVCDGSSECDGESRASSVAEEDWRCDECFECVLEKLHAVQGELKSMSHRVNAAVRALASMSEREKKRG